MKIIDAHIHFARTPYFAESARAAGHENTAEHLREVFLRNNIVMAVVMGSGMHSSTEDVCRPQTLNLAGTLSDENYNQPEFVTYCCGLESEELSQANLQASLDAFEAHFRRKECVGLKLYPGYNKVYVNDKIHWPFFELAEHYDIPVVIHTGDTASQDGLLKFSHPLTVDDAAVMFPHVRFVMAHFGTPWLADAAAVADKNPNAYIDISGLAEGNIDSATYMKDYGPYLDQLRTWMCYLADYEKIIYGSDWPIVNIDEYIKVIAAIIPERYHDLVFYDNAKRVFSKLNLFDI